MDQKLVELLEDGDEVHHGDYEGADKMAGRIAARLGLKVVPHPADWEKHGIAAGPIRNAEMMKTGPRLVIAFVSSAKFRGTKDALYCAIKARAPEIRVFTTPVAIGRAAAKAT